MSKEHKPRDFPVQDELFDDLVTQYGEALMRLAYTYVKNTAMAEDVVQDVFLTAYEKMNEFRGQSSYQTYLYRITINRCHDYLRSWTYKNLILSDTLFSLLHSKDRVDQTVIRNDEQFALGKKVFSLPVKYREVIVLHYYEDLSIDEIANLLPCPPGTVKTRLQRARAKLKMIIEGEEEWESGR